MILENNLFGVDINDEAVEIASLSLWLRTAKKGRKVNRLTNNIRSGNSLIDDPAVAGDKAFNWKEAFPSIFEKGGFDVVIGNPPYGATFNSEEKKAIISIYKTYKYKFESYIYFYEKGIDVLNQNGYLGYITPELWLSLENCEPLREFIFNNARLVEINIVGENVFVDAVVNTVIVIITKQSKYTGFNIFNKNEKWNLLYDEWHPTPKKAIEYGVNKTFSKIIKKIDTLSFHLEKIGEAIQGITPYDKYRGQNTEVIKTRGFHFNFKKDETCGKWLNGEDINRYSTSWGGEWLSYGNWLGAAREPRFFEGNRILFREIPGNSRRIQAVFLKRLHIMDIVSHLLYFTIKTTSLF